MVESSSRIRQTYPVYDRYRMLKLAAYLLAGTEEHQIVAVDYGVIGLHAKLTVTCSALFGDADAADKMVKICLLDTDPTAIPSNGLGVIKPAPQARPVWAKPTRQSLDIAKPLVENENNNIDYTSHIEPAWGYDPNLCSVTYRHHGLLVYKVNLCDREPAVLNWHVGSRDKHNAFVGNQPSNSSQSSPIVPLQQRALADYTRSVNNWFPFTTEGSQTSTPCRVAQFSSQSAHPSQTMKDPTTFHGASTLSRMGAGACLKRAAAYRLCTETFSPRETGRNVRGKGFLGRNLGATHWFWESI